MMSKSASVAPDVTVNSVTGSYSRAVETTNLRRQRLAQGEHARHRGVLVVAGLHVPVDGFDQLRVAGEVGEPLREVDGAVLVGQSGHHREDADADVGQFGFDACRGVHQPTNLRTVPPFVKRKRLHDPKGAQGVIAEDRGKTWEMSRVAPLVRIMLKF